MEKIVIGLLILTSACRVAAIQINISEDTTLLEAEKMCISKGLIPCISLNSPSVFCLAECGEEEKDLGGGHEALQTE